MKTLTQTQQAALVKTLKARFEKYMSRHKGVSWSAVEAHILKNPSKLWSLNEMEKTGGEPDVVALDKKTGEITFIDCSAESPKDRRSFCYDKAAQTSRKEFKPKNSALAAAAAMGVEVLTETQYRDLQKLGAFDLKTSSWIQTPDAIRKLGGALFCDRRYDTVFTYHNGAESYYAARGFRAILKI